MKPTVFPLAKDIQKFIKVLKEKEAKLILEEDIKNEEGYRTLAETVLIQIILFNRRRSGEVERLLLDTYVNPINCETHEDILHCLSKFEQKLVNLLTLIKTPGKFRQMVPILLTKGIVESIDLLCTARKQHESFKESRFLFATATKMKK